MAGITTSIAVTTKGWRIGRALMKPRRFSDLMQVISHTAVLDRVLKKLTADGLARKRGGDGCYELTPLGRAWIESAMPLLEWAELHPRNATPRQRSNDPVGAQPNA